MGLGVKYGPRDWYLNAENVARAIKALESRKKINRKYSVPDLAGYSKDNKTLYIDKDTPTYFEYMGKKIESDCYLLLHEEVESGLMKSENADYLDCHAIANCAEKEAVETVHGMGCWQAYADFMKEQINRAWQVKNPKTPPDLDIRPYMQQHEVSKLKSMGYIK